MISLEHRPQGHFISVVCPRLNCVSIPETRHFYQDRPARSLAVCVGKTLISETREMLCRVARRYVGENHKTWSTRRYTSLPVRKRNTRKRKYNEKEREKYASRQWLHKILACVARSNKLQRRRSHYEDRTTVLKICHGKPWFEHVLAEEPRFP